MERETFTKSLRFGKCVFLVPASLVPTLGGGMQPRRSPSRRELVDWFCFIKYLFLHVAERLSCIPPETGGTRIPTGSQLTNWAEFGRRWAERD